MDDETRTDKELDEKSERSEKTDSESEHSEEDEDKLDLIFDEDLQPMETPYIPNAEEELGQVLYIFKSRIITKQSSAVFPLDWKVGENLEK